MKIAYDLEGILKIVGNAKVEGNWQGTITGIASLKEAQAGDLSFLGNKKYTPEVPESQASLLLLPESYEGAPRPDQVFVRLENPSMALGLLCADVEQKIAPKHKPGIHSTAVVDETAQVSESAYIGPLCVVGAEAEIGSDTCLDAQVYIGPRAKVGQHCRLRAHATVMDDCILQNHVSLHAGVVIGSDGFGYEVVNGAHEKIPQIGNVVVEDNVEIGANTTIDRARFQRTLIGAGTKIDNLVQIAHNVEVGKHCLIVSQAGISGSTILGEYVVVAGQAGITGHLKIAKGTVIGAQCGLHYNTEPGTYHRGTPGNPASLANKIDVLRKRLPDLFKRVASLEEFVESQQKS